MKNKIKYILLGVVLGLIMGAVAIAAVFYMTEGASDVDLAEYIEGVLIPNVLTAVAAVGTVALAFKPQIDRIADAIGKVIDKFVGATEDVRATVESSAQSEAEARESLSRVAEFASAVEAVKSAVDEAKTLVAEVQGSSGEIKEMLMLGFGNTDELVRKGKARQIMKIGEREKEMQKETDSSLAHNPSEGADSAQEVESDGG